MVARRAWAGFSKRGFGLENLCRILGYRYQRHDALGDAKAAGVVMLAAIEQTGIGLERWLQQVEFPIGDGPRLPIRAMPQLPPGSVDDTPREASRPSNRVLGPGNHAAAGRDGTQRVCDKSPLPEGEGIIGSHQWKPCCSLFSP